jgi:hypothetical protein
VSVVPEPSPPSVEPSPDGDDLLLFELVVAAPEAAAAADSAVAALVGSYFGFGFGISTESGLRPINTAVLVLTPAIA